MAKTKMVCPFSGRLCRECALYRGRHYFLCFCASYRGYLEGEGGKGAACHPRRPLGPTVFNVPRVAAGRAIDPVALVLEDGDKEANPRC